MTQNAILRTGPDLASRLAQETLTDRTGVRAHEVRRLLDAALDVMGRSADGSARVADIVAGAGLSNDAFYRYFRSKEGLVSALIEDGTERLHGYLAHQMAKERTPEAKVRRWVEGVLAQASGDVGATTLAVLRHAGGIADGRAAGRHPASARLATLLHEPFTALGSSAAPAAASFVAHALLGTLADHLWGGTRPARADAARATALALAVARA